MSSRDVVLNQMISEQEKISRLIGDGAVMWARKTLGKNPTKQEIGSLVTVDLDSAAKYVAKYGFDSAMISYVPLEGRYLIEMIDGQWQTSFFERGKRFDIKKYTARVDAERDAIKRIIENVTLLILMSYKLQLKDLF